ncbi:class I SAM-dependent methyltransferase [Mesorhizobium silamurunense]|uniref:class I SAM-dependent methyltransferase n=1 Tax=Mesorhizobium silamurunense TaxID=499528 RepID=UPI001784C4A5|nr:methyltransferase domain-containing protein [Mesorhizobium silamurunense]
MGSDSARFTGSIPEHYDRILGPVIFAGYAEDIARRVSAFAPARVLETAAGTGIVTRRLRDALPDGAALIATDLNPPMLEVASQKFRPGEQVEFQPADAMQLPFEDASFDAVVCQFGVMFYPDKGKSYREVHRVLAPAGRYLFNVWDSPRYNPYAWIADKVVERFFPVDPPQFYKVPFSFHQVDPVKEGMIDAGFADIDISVVRLEREIPDIDQFARGVVHGNPLADQIRARGGEPEQVVQAVAEELRREFGSHPGRMPLQAIVYSAGKR